MTFTLCGSVALLLSVHSAVGSVVTNTASSGFTRWPSNIIYYSVDQTPYPLSNNLKDQNNLQQAMEQVSLDLGRCVNFTRWSPTMSNVPRVVLQTSFSSPSTPNAMCFTYPGYYPAGGANGQIATAFGSASGNPAGNCLDSQRDAMKFVVNMLGLQNEWQRQDRDTYMNGLTGTPDPNTLVSSTLQQYQLFSQARKYTAAQATAQGTDFDPNSITMVTGQRYAASQNQPVFTLKDGRTTWQQARLSRGDCTALQSLYSCTGPGYGPTPSCSSLPDPSSTTASAVSFLPSPSIITKSVQCATGTSSTTPFSGPVNIGSFLITGVGTAPNQQPTLSYAPLIDGVNLVTLAAPSPLVVTAGTGQPVTAPSCAGAACVFIAQFQLSTQPKRSYTNQQVTVTITTPNTGGSAPSPTYSIPVTINLNCAPQWQAATVFQMGPAALMATTQTKTAGTTGPNSISAVAPYTISNPSAGTLTISALTDVPKYIVNNIVEFGTKDELAKTGVTPLPQKVFVNCQGTLAKTLVAEVTATSVIGQVTATDPDGGEVAYYAWSGAVAPGATKNIHYDVSQDGIITTSVTQDPTSTSTANANTPEAVAAAVAGWSTVETGHQTVLITAVDSMGGSSTLEFRWWPACGPTS